MLAGWFGSRFKWGLAALALVGALGFYARHRASGPPAPETRPAATPDQNGPIPSTALALVEGQPNRVSVPAEVFQAVGGRLLEVEPAPAPAPLRMVGSLFLDSNRLARVHSRFSGEVVQIGAITDPDDPSGKPRALRYGDRVQTGQILAEVWSKDIGEKKSELVDALSRLAVDRAALDRLENLEKGVVPERTIYEARRNYEAGLIAVERAERTLRSWRLSDAEIDEVKAEARKIHERDPRRDPMVEKRWAEIDIRAPFAGVIVEKNVNLGDIVDPSLDLFKIADLSRIGVLANVYEEDLPRLEGLAPDRRHWRIQLQSMPDSQPIEGAFELIGDVIDPMQHTAAVMGWLDNAAGRLKVGQFIVATVDLPPDPNEVWIPTSAAIESAGLATIFVQDFAGPNQFTRRRVLVTDHADGRIHVRAQPTEREAKRGAEPLRPGEKVLAGGVVEIAAAMETLVSARAARHD